MVSILLLTAALSATNEPVLLDFSATWCGSCQTMEPTLKRLAADGYPVQKIDIDQRRDLAQRYNIQSLPTFVLLVNQQEAGRIVGPTDYHRLAGMFTAAKAAQSTAAQSTAAKAAEPRRSPALLSPQALALRSTVRLHVHDPQGKSVGTGTIIDTHKNEALILTCGHLFRDSQGQGQIEVDLFDPRATRSVSGQLISYDLEKDIAFVSIRYQGQVTPARVAPSGWRVRPGETVFSIGCDRGADPSVRVSRVTELNRYQRAPHIVVAGHPVIGRSGGGLFNENGVLLGVCNLADEIDNQGIYAGLPVVHGALDQIGQTRIYRPQSQEPPNARPKPPEEKLVSIPLKTPPAMPRDIPLADLRNTAANPNPAWDAQDAEMICIVRSRSNPQQNYRTFVLQQPPRELLDQIARSSQSPQAAPANPNHAPLDRPNPVMLQASRGQPPVNRPFPQSQPLREAPVIRAQSQPRKFPGFRLW